MDADILRVHEVQKGNPVLNHIKNVKWSFSKDIIPDYSMSTACAIFVSINFHVKHPKVFLLNFFIHIIKHVMRRIEEVGNNFRLRILLVLVDNENNLSCLQDLNKIAFINNYTIILCWSNLECARYLETIRYYEGKPTSSLYIQEKRGKSKMEMLKSKSRIS